MTAPEDAFNQHLGQFRRIIPVSRQRYHVRQFIRDAFDIVHPVVPGFAPDIGRSQILTVSVPCDSGHAGEPGGVAVLFVNGYAVLFQEVIEETHAFSVLVIVCRVHMNDSVKAFSAAVYQRGDRQLQFPINSVLFSNRERIRLHKSVMKPGHVLL